MSSDSHTPAPTPIDATALLEQGRMLLKSVQHREALAIADRLLSEFEETPEALLFAGEVHFTRANFVESERLSRQCMMHFPDEFGGPIMRCRALLATGRMSEARNIALSMADKEIADDTQIGILVTVLSGCMRPDAAYPLCNAG